MAGKLPFLKWFTGDWLRASDIRGLSPAARGVWFDLLNVMHESDRRGYLLVSGKIPSHSQLARMTGCDSGEFTRLLTEIECAGVSSRTEDEILFCRRMVKDESKRIKCSEAGRLGGHPALKGDTTLKGISKGGLSPPLKGPLCISESLSIPDDPVLEILAHYRIYHQKSLKSAQPSSKEWRLCKARMQEGYTVEELKLAIDGCHKTPHNLGHNEANQKYLGLALILRDASQVDRFMANAESPPDPGNKKQKLADASDKKNYDPNSDD